MGFPTLPLYLPVAKSRETPKETPLYAPGTGVFLCQYGKSDTRACKSRAFDYRGFCLPSPKAPRKAPPWDFPQSSDDSAKLRSATCAFFPPVTFHPIEHSGAYKSIFGLFGPFQQKLFLRFRFRLHPWNLPEDKHNGKPLLKVSGLVSGCGYHSKNRKSEGLKEGMKT
ncbi:MAG: hypothetical protein D3922_05940 [Candidatus Electrothrix sp. AR1]|nr:hypothetical protein [Candidatus Electrothrix sp. AR1]